MSKKQLVSIQKNYQFRWMKYFGFLGCLGFLYFENHKIDLLTGFIFFSFFRLYFTEKFNALNCSAELSQKSIAVGNRLFALPLIILILIANGYSYDPLYLAILSVGTIVVTFLGSAMITYFYAKSTCRKMH